MKFVVNYKMPMGAGGEFGVRESDVSKGMERVGKQSDWLKATAEGLAVLESFRGFGFDVVDMGDLPVFRQRQGGEAIFWVPYARYYEANRAKYEGHYIPLTVTAAPVSKEEVADQIREQRADQAARLDKIRADLELKKGELEIQRIQKEMEQIAQGTASGIPGGIPGGSASGLRTFEVFGLLGNGQKVPLAQVAVNQGGQYVQVPGSQILVGDSPSDGFGLAGMPGAWPQVYGGQSPANYGLDPDKAVMGHDGTRGWVLSASFLGQVFGANWRSQIYGV